MPNQNDYVWTNPDDSKGNVGKGLVWHRLNSAITDSETFTDQLALTGKFDTGFLKHRFNVGAEYSKQKLIKAAITLLMPKVMFLVLASIAIVQTYQQIGVLRSMVQLKSHLLTVYKHAQTLMQL